MYVHLYFAATASSSDRDRNPCSTTPQNPRLSGVKTAGGSSRPAMPRNATAVPSASRGADAMRPSLIRPEMMRPIVVL